MNTLKNIYSLIERLENRDGFLLNEITVKDKWQKESNKWQGKLDAKTFEYLCELDPTTSPNKVGRYANWILAKYNPNADFDRLKICLEWYADGIKRGIINRLGISNDINAYKSYDEFISAMNGVMHSNNSGMSNSEYNNRQKLEGQFEILGSNSTFDIVACKTFEAERYFGSGTEWCTVANEYYFDHYMKKGPLYIIYPKNGNKELKMQFHFESESFADRNDEVYECPIECIENTIEDEDIQTALFQLCKKVFPKHQTKFVSFREKLQVIQQRLAKGEDPEDVFDSVWDFSEGFAVVELNNKFNFINKQGQILFSQWFDEVDNFQNGFAKVVLNGKCNLINKKEQLLSNQWFDNIDNFSEGFAAVRLSGSYNFINTEGNFAFDQWFNWCMNFKEGFAAVGLQDKRNFINKQGQVISDQCFDNVRSFNEGFASVRLSGKWNFINEQGQILSNQWFDEVYDFHEGFGAVELNGKGCNFINTKGELLSNQWYDWCRCFNEGFAAFELQGKGYNFINREGKLAFNQWFDMASYFSEGFATVELKGKGYNFINTKGKYLSDQWFDYIYEFYNGFAKVKLQDKYNYINTKGKYLSNQWFDSADIFFQNGFAEVELNGEDYKIDTNGNLYDKEGNKINNNIGENKMRQRVRLTESSLKRMIKESIRQVLNEGPIPNQVNHSTQMQGAVNNGTQNEWANDYLAEKNTYYGYIAKIAKENNTSYTNVISNLQKKVTYYLNNGYFGNNKEVTSTIQLFTELLSYMHGAYESALSRVVKGMQNEASPLQRLKDYIVYPKSNSYGVQQRVNDKSGNEFAIQQGNGQWMSDLQSELQQLLKWNFLHGKKTVAATDLFIKFLEVEKRTMFKWFSKNESKIITSMKQALIGVTMLASGLGMLGIGNTNNGNNTMQQPSNNIEMTQQAPQQQTVQQGVNVSFQINQSTLSQEDIQQLQSLPQGNYKIVIHNTQNSSGKDASYDGELAQQRANQIAKYLKGSQVRYSRGSNVNGSSASAEIIPM